MFETGDESGKSSINESRFAWRVFSILPGLIVNIYLYYSFMALIHRLYVDSFLNLEIIFVIYFYPSHILIHIHIHTDSYSYNNNDMNNYFKSSL